MTQAPKKRDPSQKPLRGTYNPTPIQPQVNDSEPKGSVSKPAASKWNTCSRCMGFGGMDGSCPKCDGTGYTN